MNRKLPTVAAAVFAAVYGAARFWRLTDSCLWFDEIFSIHAAEHSWNQILPFIAKDLIHPPLFYLILKLWLGAFGDGVFWVRLLPVLFSILALVPLWMLCRELKLKASTAAVAVGLFAINGALIKYAQEVRMYSLLLFLGLMSMWLFSRYFFRGKSFWVLVITNILLVHAHYFGWFVVATEVALIAYAQRIKILRTLLMFGLTAVFFIPWIFAIYRFAEQGATVDQNIGWMRRPGLASFIEFALDLVDPFYFQQSSIEPSANFLLALPIAAILLVAAVVYAVNFQQIENTEKLLFLGTFAAVPLALVFVLSWMLPVSIWGSRHLLIVFPSILLLFAIFLTEVRPALLSNALIGSVFALSVVGLVIQVRTQTTHHIWCAFEGFAQEWAGGKQGNSVSGKLYVFEDLAAYHYWFATRTHPDLNVVLIEGVEGMPDDPAYFLPRGFHGVEVTDLNSVEGDDIWLSFRQRTPPLGLSGSDPQRRFEVPVTNFQNLGYVVADVKEIVYGPQTAYLVRMKKAPLVAGP